MIRGHVVGDKVEHKLQAALPQPLSQAGKGLGSAQVAMHGVALDGETGATDVFVPEIRQGCGELVPPLGMGT